jgi:hypothetical protein
MSSAGQIDRPRFGGAVIPARQVQVLTAPALAPKLAPRPEPCREKPQISIIKEGDTVRAIEVTCSCGEKIRLECEY